MEVFSDSEDDLCSDDVHNLAVCKTCGIQTGTVRVFDPRTPSLDPYLLTGTSLACNINGIGSTCTHY